jgi:hypothetical protein
MDQKTLCGWLHRYDAGGIEVLKSRKAPGAEPSLNKADMAELRDLVLRGLDLATHGVVR